MLAAASDAIIIGFNVRPQGKATEVADREGVEIRYYSVIYQAIEEIEAALKGMLKPEFEEATAGHGGDPRDLPLHADRQHRRLHGHQRDASDATPRRGCCATGRSSPTTSTCPACAARRTTSPRSARASSAAWCCAATTTSRIGDVVETFEMREIPRA